MLNTIILSYTNYMNVLLIGGSIMPSIFLIMQLVFTLSSSSFTWNNKSTPSVTKCSTYLESELLDLSTSTPIVQVKFYKNLVNLYWILLAWCYLLILTTFAHLFFPIGLPSSMPYHLGYWLWTCALSLWMSPFIIYGYQLISAHIEAGLRPNLHIKCEDTNILSNRLYYREWSRGTTYERNLIIFLEDLFCVTSFLRGFNALINWVYQCSYFGTRLWLVFVLHSFCLGCFGELFTVATDGFFLLSWPIGGFIGLGLPLSLLMVGYLLIQIYVYISFSVTFLFDTVIQYFRADYQSFADFHGPKTWNHFWLVPVSVVDFAPTHLIIYLAVLLILAILTSRHWMYSNHASSYRKIYDHIINK
jgi:hypothetical protein